MQVAGTLKGRVWGVHLSPLPAAQVATSVPPRGDPRQAGGSLLRCGGHPAGVAALVEDHRDLQGPVALLPDQWTECPAGERARWEKARVQPAGKVETQLLALVLLPVAAAHGARHCRVYPRISAIGRPGEAALHRCA